MGMKILYWSIEGAGNLNPNFYWDDCHGHAHYEGYANYKTYNYPSLEPSETIGHKNGWCVMDLGAAVSSETPDYITNPTPVVLHMVVLRWELVKVVQTLTVPEFLASGLILQI